MYIWVGADVDSQLGEIKEYVKKTEEALGLFHSTLTLPLHISLKISFCVDDRIVDEVIDSLSEIYETIKPFYVSTKRIEHRGKLVWIRMKKSAKLDSIHNRLDKELYDKHGVELHDLDRRYLFHTTLFMCEDKEQSGAAFEAVKKAPLPKKLRIDRLVIGTSPDGTVGSYQVIKTVCLHENKMRILFGTTNESKLRSMQRVTEEFGIKLIGLRDLNKPLPQVDESGDILQNAEQKARAYWRAFHIPVFSCDSGLYLDELPLSLQPGPHVRRVNGKTLSDEEMTDYYAALARAHGGELVARYRNAICFVFDENTVFKSDADALASRPFLLTDVPHEKREKGYPLDALSKEISTGQYYYDLPGAAFEDDTVDKGFRDFLKDVLRKIGG